MARRERSNLSCVCIEKRVGPDHNRVSPFVDELCESRIQFTLTACIGDYQPPSELLRSRLRISNVYVRVWIIWIHEHAEGG